MGVLDGIAAWPVSQVAAAVVGAHGVVEVAGDIGWATAVASVTKPLVAYGCLVAVEEGTLALEQAAGPERATLRHLLAHASGLPFEGDAPIAAPATRRIYSNTGFRVVGDVLAEAAGMAAGDYVREAVFEPLGMGGTELRREDTWAGVFSTVGDLVLFASELLAPTLVAPETLADGVSEQFPGLAGVVPGLGSYDPNPWGLGFELKGAKAPHWTAPGGSPRTFGHFGGAGTFLWVDPDARLACVVLTDRSFGDWAPPLWAALSQQVLDGAG